MSLSNPERIVTKQDLKDFYDEIYPYLGKGDISLNDLNNTTITTPTDGQILIYDATTSKWINGAAVADIDELGDISDVDLTNLTDGQIIIWDNTNSKWVNGNLPSIPTTTSDLTNDSGFITAAALPTAVSDLTNDAGYAVAANLATVATSGSYNDLSNTPTIPAAISDLTDDSGFITNAVNDLVNYYLKSETYTKTEVDTIATNIRNSRFEVVSTLPTTDIKTNVIYLVPKSTAGTNNVKDEYINLDGTSNGWEKIGDTEVDLSGYVTTSALNTALADYVTSTGLTTILADYALSSSLATVATSGSYNDLSNAPTIPDELTDLTDINISSPTDGQVLAYDFTTSKWINSSNSGGGASTLDNLSDVTITSAVSGEVLKNNGSGWINSQLSASDVGLSNVNNTSDVDKPVSIATQTALNTKQDTIQHSTMPTAGIDYAGKIVQFIGTTGTYTNGYFYECVEDNGSYSWVAKSVQAGGGGNIMLTETLLAGGTTVTFTNPAISGNSFIDIYTDQAGLDFNTIDASVANTITLTYDAPISDVTVVLVIKGDA